MAVPVAAPPAVGSASTFGGATALGTDDGAPALRGTTVGVGAIIGVVGCSTRAERRTSEYPPSTTPMRAIAHESPTITHVAPSMGRPPEDAFAAPGVVCACAKTAELLGTSVYGR